VKVTDLIKNQNKPFYSLEISPPLKTKSIEQIFSVIDKILPYNLSFVNITYHQKSSAYEEVNGQMRKVIYQKHANTVGVCSAIKYKYNIEAVPHLLCGGVDKITTEDTLFDLMFMGIENILALRGDPRRGQDDFVPEEMGNKNAAELVQQIKAMNQSVYIQSDSPEVPIDFCVGVGAYPEKHYSAKSLEDDVAWLKHKVDSGADFIVTQMFFDFDLFVKWEKMCRQAGITVPIIPGLKPLTKKKQVELFTENFHLSIPAELRDAMEKAETPKEAYQAGIDYMAKLCRKLLDYGVPGLHFFTMGKGQDVADLIEKLENK